MLRSTPTQALRSMACLCTRRYDACAAAETQNKCKNVKYSKTVLDPQTCNLHRNHAASNCAAAPHMRHVCIKSELVRLNPNSHNAQICVHYTCGKNAWVEQTRACMRSIVASVNMCSLTCQARTQPRMRTPTTCIAVRAHAHISIVFTALQHIQYCEAASLAKKHDVKQCQNCHRKTSMWDPTS